MNVAAILNDSPTQPYKAEGGDYERYAVEHLDVSGCRDAM
jgi:hypothetical protein